ncbi:MAG TPA: glycosyltransferase family 9 protein [Tepidisphaeraceae bacterium]|jgi:ADP-heptose:LPS heptosyltransferase
MPRPPEDRHRPLAVVPLVAGIGNALLCEPMLRQLAGSHRVVVMAISRPIAAVAERVPGVEVRVTGKGNKNMLAAARASRGMKPDVYLVPFPSNRWQYNILAAASGAKRVVTHVYPVGRWSALAFLHGNRVPAVKGIHDVEQNLHLLPAVGIEPDWSMAPRFELTAADRAAAGTLLEQLGVDRPFVVVHAGSANTVLAAAKRWPPAHYAKLAEAIRDETGLDVVVVEGPDEAGVSDAIASHLIDRRAVHTAKLTCPLGVTAALLERSRFYAGTDSGLAHLAAAVGRRAVTLFAPADPDRVCPFGQRDLVVQPPGDTTPSFLYPWEATKPKMRFEDQRIESITVAMVMEKVNVLVAQ